MRSWLVWSVESKGKKEVDPAEYLGSGTEAEYLCWNLAGGVASEFDRLLATDYVQVWRMLAYRKMDGIEE